MSFQGTSAFLPAGIPGFPGVVAQIFFPTSQSNFDGFDVTVLGSLCSHYQRVLQRRRVELIFLGHADHRGGDGFNFLLGQRRATSVENFVHQRLRTLPLFTSWPGVSAGEAASLQPVALGSRTQLPTTEQLALDRRVDVYSTFLGEHRRENVPLPVPDPPRILRPTFREFLAIEHEEISASDTDDHSLRDAILAIPDLLADTFTNTPGEEITDPRAQLLSATFRVNRVRIDVRIKSFVEPFVLITETRTKVRYEWGPPRQQVLIERQIHIRAHAGETIDQPTQTRMVPRAEADANPFLFPTLHRILGARINRLRP